MTVSGGLLSWAGAYLTQFFYYPLLGAGLLCLFWAFLIVLLKKAFCIPDRWFWLTLIPMAMLLLSNVSLGYWLYFLKLRGHFFLATLGVMAVATLVWIYRLLPQCLWLRILFIVVATVVSYPLFGFYGLLATLLMGLTTHPSSLKLQISNFILQSSILSIAIVPLVYYYFYYHQTTLANIYWTALPIFVQNGVKDTWQNVPYIVIVLWLVIAAFKAPAHRSSVTNLSNGMGGDSNITPHNSQLKSQNTPSTIQPSTFKILHSIIGVCLLILIVIIGWNKDGNFHRELTMRRYMEQQDWHGVLATMKSVRNEPTRTMCMMKNLALQRMGSLSKEFGNYPDGFCRPVAPYPIHAVHTVGKMIYLQFGLPNYCYRWCMEDGVEYGWTTEGLKLMVKCSLLNREMMAAQHYLALLKKTTFHSSWARRYEAYIRQPRLMMQDAEFKGIFPLIRNDNFLTSDQSQLELFLIEQLASSPGSTPEQRELAAFCYRMYMNRFKYLEK